MAVAVLLDFDFLLGRNDRATFATPDRPAHRDVMDLGAGMAPPLHDSLYFFEFGPRYHPFVLPVMPDAASQGIFKLSAVEGIGEYEIHITEIDLRSHPAGETPLMHSDFPYLRYRVRSRKHHVPTFADEVELRLVLQHFFLVMLLYWIVQVSDGSRAGNPSTLRFCPHASLRVHAQVPHELVRHSEFHVHHEDIIRGIVAPSVGLDMLDDALLQEPADLPAVDGIAGQPVQFPADDALCLALADPHHHLIEHGTSRLLC